MNSQQLIPLLTCPNWLVYPSVKHQKIQVTVLIFSVLFKQIFFSQIAVVVEATESLQEGSSSTDELTCSSSSLSIGPITPKEEFTLETRPFLRAVFQALDCSENDYLVLFGLCLLRAIQENEGKNNLPLSFFPWAVIYWFLPGWRSWAGLMSIKDRPVQAFFFLSCKHIHDSCKHFFPFIAFLWIL